jgi:hypothetical protein
LKPLDPDQSINCISWKKDKICDNKTIPDFGWSWGWSFALWRQLYIARKYWTLTLFFIILFLPIVNIIWFIVFFVLWWLRGKRWVWENNKHFPTRAHKEWAIKVLERFWLVNLWLIIFTIVFIIGTVILSIYLLQQYFPSIISELNWSWFQNLLIENLDLFMEDDVNNMILKSINNIEWLTWNINIK